MFKFIFDRCIPGERTPDTMNWKLFGPKKTLGVFGKKNCLVPAGNQTPDHPARSQVSVLTEISVHFRALISGPLKLMFCSPCILVQLRVNDHLDAQLRYIKRLLLQSFTCFEQYCAHHQEVKLY